MITPFILPRHKSNIFEDDFRGYKNDVQPFGWTEVVASVSGIWKVVGGKLIGYGGMTTTLSPDNFIARNVKIQAEQSKGSNPIRLTARLQREAITQYLVNFNPGYGVKIYRESRTSFTQIADAPFTYNLPAIVEFEIINNILTASINNKKIISVSDDIFTEQGYIGVYHSGETESSPVSINWIRAVAL